jgi:hypothetical protein
MSIKTVKTRVSVKENVPRLGVNRFNKKDIPCKHYSKGSWCYCLGLEYSPKVHVLRASFPKVLLEGGGTFKRWDLLGGFSSSGVWPCRRLWDASLFYTLLLLGHEVSGFALLCVPTMCCLTTGPKKQGQQEATKL